jgi:glycosyltransferase involved in cell wall biosynthesis
LVDFRADEDLVEAEREALRAAARVITPHRAIASHFGARALLLEWNTPSTNGRIETLPTKPRWFFPASALARKGIHELVAALDGRDEELWVLGRAREGRGDPLQGRPFRSSLVTDWRHCTAVVMPAWVEHEPRIALHALIQGVPVIASRACGLPEHSLLIEIEAGDPAALRAAMDRLVSREVF